MQLIGSLLLMFSTFFHSEGNVPVSMPAPKVLTFEEVEAYVQKIDLLKEKKQLTKYEYRDMTAWGSLTGYWDKNGLVVVHSRYNAEAGFRECTVYYYKEEICRIVCNDHMANWGQYDEEHGDEPFDMSKLTYTDKLYDYTSGTELIYREFDGSKMVNAKADSTLYNELVVQAGKMQLFIEEAAN